MKKILDFIRGYIFISVTCPYPERFFNICAMNGIELWDIHIINEGEITACVSINDRKTLKEILPVDFEMKTQRRRGAPFFLVKFKKRYALIAMMALMLAILWSSSLYIWEIQITGNESVTTSEILYALDTLGVKPGMFRLNFPQEYISNAVLLEIPELSYVSVNTVGSVANVVVREKIEVPEMYDRSKPVSIYAKKDGQINKLTVLNGKNLVEKGDSVLAGETIVTGKMDSIDGDIRFVHAKAKVYARTWYDAAAKMPSEIFEKSYTGEKEVKRAIIFGGKRLNLYFDSRISYADYDKITKEIKPTLFGIIPIPITVIEETYDEYLPMSMKLDETALSELLVGYLRETLSESMDGGTIITADFEKENSEDTFTVTMRAECTEQIGAEREMTEDELSYEKAEEGDL